jgi:hypothetical protein
VQPEALVRSDPVSMMRQKLERDRAVRDGIVATVARLQEDPLDALAVFTKAAEEHAIALTSVRIDEGISIEGLLLGAAARNALAAGMETAKLSVSRTEWSRAGACEAFSITAAAFTPRRTRPGSRNRCSANRAEGWSARHRA